MAKPNCEKCIHKAVCDNYEQWIGDITGFENIRATKCLYFQEVGWVSVEDRLPEKDEKCLCRYGFEKNGIKHKMMFTGCLDYYACDLQPHWQHGSTELFVTHWMPLPDPPKEG